MHESNLLSGLKTSWLRVLPALLLLAGCAERAPTAPPVLPADRTVSFDRDTLFLTGDRWVFSFDVHGRQCYIIGDCVAFEKKETDHIVVKLDPWLSINVPTTREHRVHLVDKDGFVDVSVDPDKCTDTKQLIEEVIQRKAGHG
jgi:hypothetical protein